MADDAAGLDEERSPQKTLYLDGLGFKRVMEAPPGLELISVRDNRLRDLGAIAGCPSLREIDLSGNRLVEDALAPLASFPKLRVLNIAKNQLSDLAKLFETGTFPALEVLDVSQNAGIVDLAATFSAPRLSRLMAKGTGTSALVCSHSDTLEVLDLRGCAMRSIERLPLLQSLRELLLDENCLEGCEALASHPTLRVLRLAKNALHEAGCLHLPSLTILDLTGNKLQAPPSLPLSSMLASLSLRENSMVSLSALAPLHNLTFLDASQNQLTKLEPALSAAVLASVKVLILTGNRFKAVEDVTEALQTCPRMCLQHLDLRSNPLTLAFYPVQDAGAAEQARTRPALTWEATTTLAELDQLSPESGGLLGLDGYTWDLRSHYRARVASSCERLEAAGQQLLTLDGVLVAPHESLGGKDVPHLGARETEARQRSSVAALGMTSEPSRPETPQSQHYLGRVSGDVAEGLRRELEERQRFVAQAGGNSPSAAPGNAATRGADHPELLPLTPQEVASTRGGQEMGKRILPPPASIPAPSVVAATPIGNEQRRRPEYFSIYSAASELSETSALGHSELSGYGGSPCWFPQTSMIADDVEQGSVREVGSLVRSSAFPGNQPRGVGDGGMVTTGSDVTSAQGTEQLQLAGGLAMSIPRLELSHASLQPTIVGRNNTVPLALDRPKVADADVAHTGAVVRGLSPRRETLTQTSQACVATIGQQTVPPGGQTAMRLMPNATTESLAASAAVYMTRAAQPIHQVPETQHADADVPSTNAPSVTSSSAPVAPQLAGSSITGRSDGHGGCGLRAFGATTVSERTAAATSTTSLTSLSKETGLESWVAHASGDGNSSGPPSQTVLRKADAMPPASSGSCGVQGSASASDAAAWGQRLVNQIMLNESTAQLQEAAAPLQAGGGGVSVQSLGAAAAAAADHAEAATLQPRVPVPTCQPPQLRALAEPSRVEQMPHARGGSRADPFARPSLRQPASQVLAGCMRTRNPESSLAAPSPRGEGQQPRRLAAAATEENARRVASSSPRSEASELTFGIRASTSEEVHKRSQTRAPVAAAKLEEVAQNAGGEGHYEHVSDIISKSMVDRYGKLPTRTSRDAYLEFLEREIASQQAFLDLQRSARQSVGSRAVAMRRCIAPAVGKSPSLSRGALNRGFGHDDRYYDAAEAYYEEAPKDLPPHNDHVRARVVSSGSRAAGRCSGRPAMQDETSSKYTNTVHGGGVSGQAARRRRSRSYEDTSSSEDDWRLAVGRAAAEEGASVAGGAGARARWWSAGILDDSAGPARASSAWNGGKEIRERGDSVGRDSEERSGVRAVEKGDYPRPSADRERIRHFQDDVNQDGEPASHIAQRAASREHHRHASEEQWLETPEAAGCRRGFFKKFGLEPEPRNKAPSLLQRELWQSDDDDDGDAAMFPSGAAARSSRPQAEQRRTASQRRDGRDPAQSGATARTPTVHATAFAQGLDEVAEFSSRSPAVPSSLLRSVTIIGPGIPSGQLDEPQGSKHPVTVRPLPRTEQAAPTALSPDLPGSSKLHRDNSMAAVVCPVDGVARKMLQELFQQQAWQGAERPLAFRYTLGRAVESQNVKASAAFDLMCQRDVAKAGVEPLRSTQQGNGRMRAFFCDSAKRMACVISSPLGFASAFEGMVLLFALDLRHAESLSAACDWSPCDCGTAARPKYLGRTLVANLAVGQCDTARCSLQDAIPADFAAAGSHSGTCGAVPMGEVFQEAYAQGSDSLYFPKQGVIAILQPSRALPLYLVEYWRQRLRLREAPAGAYA
eukprot:TRINITY_DN20798_c0_g1_i1.p1 TRINITY_DN20798_c0_g1~~TRINITY_DN20798_c0_g1_i1.p1  ORF type:complete len:1775 (-),score=306.94 TRINITY_DN20798_c0_g1_i1:216-5540(-)